MTDVLQAALKRVGATTLDSEALPAMLAGLSSSREAFDQWNSRLPDAAGRPLLRAIEAADGETFARDIINQIRDQMMQHFNISEEEIARHFRSIGLN